jgi:hypothetical protein
MTISASGYDCWQGVTIASVYCATTISLCIVVNLGLFATTYIGSRPCLIITGQKHHNGNSSTFTNTALWGISMLSCRNAPLRVHSKTIRSSVFGGKGIIENVEMIACLPGTYEFLKGNLIWVMGGDWRNMVGRQVTENDCYYQANLFHRRIVTFTRLKFHPHSFFNLVEVSILRWKSHLLQRSTK